MSLAIRAKNGSCLFTAALAAVLEGLGFYIECGHEYMVKAQALEVKCSQYSDS